MHAALIFLVILLGTPVWAQETVDVRVDRAFIDLHAGPGEDFPVTHTIERGERAEILSRRTDWYRVRSPRQVEGWLHRSMLGDTRDPETAPEWAMGLSLLRFDGDPGVAAHAEVFVSNRLSVGGAVLSAHSDTTDVRLVSATARQHFDSMGEFRPFAGAGLGRLDITDERPEREGVGESLPHVLLGLDLPVRAGVRFRVEYRRHIPGSNADSLQETDEWNAGIVAVH